jgi:multisubunit Na+/H+ antiporter MnhB subunit
MFAQFRPDLALQGLAWLANLAVVIGCALGYRRIATKSGRDAGRFTIAFVASTAFLVGATALLAPSYLSNLSGILHPHWPWVQQ